MKIESLSIPEVKIIKPKSFGDDRGYFSETYNKQALADAGILETFVQDNQSFSATRGTMRGLHFQIPPFAQAKLVRVLRGSILDVAVDLRRGSPTYGRHVSAVISAREWNQILVPVGFAHGFCTLGPTRKSFTRCPPRIRRSTTGVCPGSIRISASTGRWPRRMPSCRLRIRSCPASLNYPTASPTISNCELVRRRTAISIDAWRKTLNNWK